MFRFSLRELLLLITCAALGLGWWLDHRSTTEAGKVSAEDARMLAAFSANPPSCGISCAWFSDLQKKYGAKRIVFTIYSGDEEKLGIDFEE
jgi:hypothetical protein